MTTTITDEAIGARAYDLLEDGRTYTAADLAATREEAARQLAAETHAVAPDRGRNVHCTCGAEYSLAANLRRHIDAKAKEAR